VDVARTEAADAELTRMIERRARNGEVDPDEREKLWKASVARHNARRRTENCQAWASFHERQAERFRRTMEPLIAFHKARAATLLEGEGDVPAA